MKSIVLASAVSILALSAAQAATATYNFTADLTYNSDSTAGVGNAIFTTSAGDAAGTATISFSFDTDDLSIGMGFQSVALSSFSVSIAGITEGTTSTITYDSVALSVTNFGSFQPYALSLNGESSTTVDGATPAFGYNLALNNSDLSVLSAGNFSAFYENAFDQKQVNNSRGSASVAAPVPLPATAPLAAAAIAGLVALRRKARA
ncbi:MAG: hypothetical protein ACPGNV_16925 [Mangrovicoccus sp.]